MIDTINIYSQLFDLLKNEQDRFNVLRSLSHYIGPVDYKIAARSKMQFSACMNASPFFRYCSRISLSGFNSYPEAYALIYVTRDRLDYLNYDHPNIETTNAVEQYKRSLNDIDKEKNVEREVAAKTKRKNVEREVAAKTKRKNVEREVAAKTKKVLAKDSPRKNIQDLNNMKDCSRCGLVFYMLEKQQDNLCWHDISSAIRHLNECSFCNKK